VVATLFALPLAVQAQGMNQADHDAAKSRIAAQYKFDKAACSSRAGNAKDVCIEQAKGKEKVARADLEYAYSGKSADRNKVLVARAETNYAVAREKCDDQAGNAKDVCVSEAKAIESKALAEAKLGKEIVQAEKDAGAQMREADLQVAVEKCDALSGDAKAACVATAQAKFGKR